MSGFGLFLISIKQWTWNFVLFILLFTWINLVPCLFVINLNSFVFLLLRCFLPQQQKQKRSELKSCVSLTVSLVCKLFVLCTTWKLGGEWKENYGNLHFSRTEFICVFQFCMQNYNWMNCKLRQLSPAQKDNLIRLSLFNPWDDLRQNFTMSLRKFSEISHMWGKKFYIRVIQGQNIERKKGSSFTPFLVCMEVLTNSCRYIRWNSLGITNKFKCRWNL